jgi:tetratricopeptide (TPR) repeat protein
MRRRLALSLGVALLLSWSLPPRVPADGGMQPPPSPSPPPSVPSSQPAQPEMTPEEKALADRREAEQIYASAYKEVEKGKAELAEAESLAASGDAKLADKVAKKNDSATKRFKKSLDKFAAATQLSADYAEAWNMLGFCYRKTGDSQKGFQAYWECLRLKPDYAPAREYLGEAYLEADNLPKAQEQLAWLKEHDPGEATRLEKRVQKYLEQHPQASAAEK